MDLTNDILRNLEVRLTEGRSEIRVSDMPLLLTLVRNYQAAREAWRVCGGQHTESCTWHSVGLCNCARSIMTDALMER